MYIYLNLKSFFILMINFLFFSFMKLANPHIEHTLRYKYMYIHIFNLLSVLLPRRQQT